MSDGTDAACPQGWEISALRDLPGLIAPLRKAGLVKLTLGSMTLELAPHVPDPTSTPESIPPPQSLEDILFASADPLNYRETSRMRT